jgi:hypothetical protein
VTSSIDETIQQNGYAKKILHQRSMMLIYMLLKLVVKEAWASTSDSHEHLVVTPSLSAVLMSTQVARYI